MNFVQFHIGPNFQICLIYGGRQQFGVGFYSREGRGWRTRHVFFGFCRRPINFIGW